MKIVYNIYVAVRKLWNAIFGKNGDGSHLVIPGRISGASGDVTVGEGLNLTNNVMKSTVPVVSANPETGESDPELTGLMIGNNKYKVPSGGGGSVFVHSLKMRVAHSSDNMYLTLTIISNSNEQFTRNTLVSYLQTNYTFASGNCLSCSGWLDYPDLRCVDGLCYNTSGELLYVSSVYVNGNGSVIKNSGHFALAVTDIKDIADKVIAL